MCNKSQFHYPLRVHLKGKGTGGIQQRFSTESSEGEGRDEGCKLIKPIIIIFSKKIVFNLFIELSLVPAVPSVAIRYDGLKLIGKETQEHSGL